MLLPACQKVVSYEEDHPGVVNFCRIEGFNLGPDGAGQKVTYDEQGNPVSIVEITPTPNLAGQNFYFRYDKHNRLTDYQIVYYGGSEPVIWDRYSYPRKNIVIDSEYAYETGALNAPHPDPAGFDHLTVDSLDDQGRLAGPVYDERGDDITNPAWTYDDKINVYRTSYTWMFLFRDFSTNNVLNPANFVDGGIASYNQYGLPLTFSNPIPIQESFALFYLPFTVSYSCSLDPDFEKK